MGIKNTEGVIMSKDLVISNKNLQIVDFFSSIQTLDAYIAKVNAIPMLTMEQEQELARRLYEGQDTEAAKLLILPHLKYVVKVAKQYSGYGLSQEDLIQEGNIGLLKAVKRFDPNVGVRLVTFAVHWIKSEMHEYIIKNWRIVKIATTKAQRKLFFKLRSFKKRLGWFSEDEINTVANDLGVKPEEVVEMELRLNANDSSFSMTSDEDEGNNSSGSFLPSPEQYLTSDKNQFDPAIILEKENWQEYANEKLYKILDQLDDRTKDIIYSRWLKDGDKATLSDLAKKYSISAERVRQLENMALQKLKSCFQD